MEDIVKLGERTYYIPNATNIGIYRVNDKDVWLIDTGIDDDTGKRILKRVAEYDWNVVGIISTHAHADHVGGNKLVRARTGCEILAHGAEAFVAEKPFMNNAAVFGGYTYDELNTKFFLARSAGSVKELDGNLPEGLSYFELPGHTYDMVGIKTSDNVYFLADSLVSPKTIEKYHVFYLYDLSAHLKTLTFLSDLCDGNKKSGVKAVYVPCHCEASEDISDLIKLNRENIIDIRNVILASVQTPKTLEEVVREVFYHYDLVMNAIQHALLTSTVRSFLSWLKNDGLVEIEFEDNFLKYKAV